MRKMTFDIISILFFVGLMFSVFYFNLILLCIFGILLLVCGIYYFYLMWERSPEL